MPDSRMSADAFRVADLPRKQTHSFDLQPDAARLDALAASLGVSGLRKLRFTGEITPEGAADWRLTGTLGATVVQPCGITLEPVITRIDTGVRRSYRRDYVEPDAPETEMPEDETAEPLGRWIDPDAVMQEELALAIPLYPRKADAELGEAVHTEPGRAPMRDADARPFAGLAALRDAMDRKDDEGD